MKITESYLRNIIKEELQKILSESDEERSFEDWVQGQMSQEKYNKLKPADKKILQDRYNQYKVNLKAKKDKLANPLSPEQQATEDARESNRIFRQSSRYSR